MSQPGEKAEAPQLGEEALAPVPQPGAETPPPAEGTPPPAAAEAQPGTEPPPPAPKPTFDYRDKEIERLRGLRDKLREQLAQATNTSQVPGESTPEYEARVEARARALSEEQTKVLEWNRRCQEVLDLGRGRFQDFDGAIQTLVKNYDRGDPQEARQYDALLAAAMETGEAPRLLYGLSQDLGKFRDLIAKAPMRMAVELARMAAALPQEKTQSEAPRPLGLKVGSQGVHYETIEPDDIVNGGKLTTAEWMARREKQARERHLQ